MAWSFAFNRQPFRYESAVRVIPPPMEELAPARISQLPRQPLGTLPVFPGFPIWAVLILGTLLVLPFTLTLALNNSPSHDEYQHIAAGVLFAREGLLPYRDFAYFHLPYLVYAYGLLFK